MEGHCGWYPEVATRLKRGSLYSTYSIVAGAATKSTEIPNALVRTLSLPEWNRPNA